MADAAAFNVIPTRILAPIDFSASSRTALDMAADLADHFHAELHLVHVIPTFPGSTFADFVPEAKFLDEARKDAERHFASAQADLAARGIKIVSSIEESNDVAGCIMDLIDRDKIDMVVVSTHGMTGWHPLVFGSIAEKIVRLAQCPLMLLRSARPETSVKIPSGRLMEWW